MNKIFRACGCFVIFNLLCTATVQAQPGAVGDEMHPVVLVRTNMGPIVIRLDAEKAPLTVKNFLAYVESGFYRNMLIHRVVPGFVIQGGGGGSPGSPADMPTASSSLMRSLRTWAPHSHKASIQTTNFLSCSLVSGGSGSGSRFQSAGQCCFCLSAMINLLSVALGSTSVTSKVIPAQGRKAGPVSLCERAVVHSLGGFQSDLQAGWQVHEVGRRSRGRV